MPLGTLACSSDGSLPRCVPDRGNPYCRFAYRHETALLKPFGGLRLVARRDHHVIPEIRSRSRSSRAARNESLSKSPKRLPCRRRQLTLCRSPELHRRALPSKVATLPRLCGLCVILRSPVKREKPVYTSLQPNTAEGCRNLWRGSRSQTRITNVERGVRASILAAMAFLFRDRIVSYSAGIERSKHDKR